MRDTCTGGVVNVGRWSEDFWRCCSEPWWLRVALILLRSRNLLSDRLEMQRS